MASGCVVAADTVDAANANTSRVRAYIGHFIVALELTIKITCWGSACWLAGLAGGQYANVRATIERIESEAAAVQRRSIGRNG